MSKRRKYWDPVRLSNDPGSPQNNSAALYRAEREQAPSLDGDDDGEEARQEKEVQSYTLVFDRRGAQARARFITPDGAERATEWRAFDHGMFAAVNELLNDWKREGPLGGFGRIPRAAQRAR